MSQPTWVPSDAGEALHLLIQFLETNQRLIYVQVATLTVLVVSIVMTLGVEIRHIWKRKQTITTLLFYIIRYLPPICVGLSLWQCVSYDVKYLGDWCLVWRWIDAIICTMVVQTLAETMMVMRMWVLYNFSKRMLVFLGALVGGGTVIGLWAAATIVASLHSLPWPREALPLPGCLSTVPKTTYTIQVTLAYHMVSKGIIFICMLNRCMARHPLDQPFLGTWRDLFGIRTAWPIVHIFIRDGCLYFLMVFFSDAFLLILMSTSNQISFFILPMIQTAYAIPSTRLILNLRERSHYDLPRGSHNDFPMDDRHEASALQFARRNSSDT